jgi:hypothetical protein
MWYQNNCEIFYWMNQILTAWDMLCILVHNPPNVINCIHRKSRRYIAIFMWRDFNKFLLTWDFCWIEIIIEIIVPQLPVFITSETINEWSDARNNYLELTSFLDSIKIRRLKPISIYCTRFAICFNGKFLLNSFNKTFLF